MRCVAAHHSELGFQFVDVLLRRIWVNFREVAIQNIPFVPLEPAAGFEHAEKVLEERARVVVADDADEVADVDDVVLLDQVVRNLGENVYVAEADVLGEPGARRALAEVDIYSVELSGAWELVGHVE